MAFPLFSGVLWCCLVLSAPAAGPSPLPFDAPFLSDPQSRTFLFSLPAPRGLILDRNGQVLAANRSIRRAGLFLSQVPGEDESARLDAALALIESFAFPDRLMPGISRGSLRHHLEHRPDLPFIFTESLSEEEAAASSSSPFTIQAEYERTYPHQSTACHVIGYVTRDVLRPAGPLHQQEPLWPEVHGRDGLERVFDEPLRGTDGILHLSYLPGTTERREHLVRPPEAGESLVLTINLEMQKLAERILRDGGRASAFVVADADNGEILAMASHPTYDIGKFVPRISEADFNAMKDRPGNPFFPRAHGGLYPPGSIFKPFVALAALRTGTVSSSRSSYDCPPSLDVAGRNFRNWSSESGSFDLIAALRRSNNVWFFQAGLDTGGEAIVEAARDFGFGSLPALDLAGVAAGDVPSSVVAARAIANLSIGQGDLLVSPLQITMAMCALANGSLLPRPQLILQRQTSPPLQQVLSSPSVEPPTPLPFHASHIAWVRRGLWEVVNAENGTGTRARLDAATLYGKTGTAQWTRVGGKDRWVVWFSGFVVSSTPRMGFAIMCESHPGEPIFGGQECAPMAREFFDTLFDSPSRFHLAPSAAPDSGSRKLPTVRARPILIYPPRQE